MAGGSAWSPTLKTPLPAKCRRLCGVLPRPERSGADSSGPHAKEEPIALRPPGGACSRVELRPALWSWMRCAWFTTPPRPFDISSCVDSVGLFGERGAVSFFTRELVIFPRLRVHSERWRQLQEACSRRIRVAAAASYMHLLPAALGPGALRPYVPLARPLVRGAPLLPRCTSRPLCRFEPRPCFRGAAACAMQAESPEEVPFIVRPEPLPFLLACVAAAAGAAAAVFYGATLAAVAWLAAALVLERVSRRAVPLPDDILAFAPPTNVLGGGDGSGGGKGSAGEERLSQAIQTVMRQQIAAGTQIGMAVAVYYKGRNVAHVCGGVFRPMGGGGGGDAWKAVDANTLFMSYSVCKGVAAAGLMTCIDRGECAYADPVVDAWPSFDKTGEKHSVTIADAVSHRAGMPGLRPSFLPVVAAHLFRDWHSAWRTGLAFIEDYSPEWTPGTQAQYHYVSFSWIIGGIIEHASRLHIHQLVRDRIEAPLGEAGRMFVGLLPSAALDRAARLECPPRYPLLPDGWDAGGEREEMGKAGWVGEWMRLVVGWIESSVFVEAGNSALWRKVCMPSS